MPRQLATRHARARGWRFTTLGGAERGKCQDPAENGCDPTKSGSPMAKSGSFWRLCALSGEGRGRELPGNSAFDEADGCVARGGLRQDEIANGGGCCGCSTLSSLANEGRTLGAAIPSPSQCFGACHPNCFRAGGRIAWNNVHAREARTGRVVGWRRLSVAGHKLTIRFCLVSCLLARYSLPACR
jgi:hypothetical protein